MAAVEAVGHGAKHVLAVYRSRQAVEPYRQTGHQLGIAGGDTPERRCGRGSVVQLRLGEGFGLVVVLYAIVGRSEFRARFGVKIGFGAGRSAGR
ncbi:hypothetical protein, partial [Methylomonas koyamae]|uniref:hypothetical protein n=1 Tax=Methylomonas koyamae TaxID=702114 RepID=UPI000A967C37